MPSQNTAVAPVYRYFAVDLLTNRILAEVPLRDVSFECAITAAGKFSGRIPVIDATSSQNLQDVLMPGNTALYAVRNGKCVWGGIIWDRNYQLTTKDLRISASEFTSYFYHRKIWKSWNHKYGATVTWDGINGWQAIFDNGSNVAVKPGSTVRMEFFDMSDRTYDGYYRVLDAPAPTTDGFSLIGGNSVSDITSMLVENGYATIYTKENHGYSSGDVVTINLTSRRGFVLPNPLVVSGVADVPGGPASNLLRIPVNETASAIHVAEGTVVKPLARGTYNDVTVTVRLDTFDYIRSLIDSMFDDYVGVDFPNVYIEPGISVDFPVINKQLVDGYAIIQTAVPHGVAPGQAIQARDLGLNYDGEFEVTDTPSDTLIVYEAGGVQPLTSVARRENVITGIAMDSGTVTASTSSAHGFMVGQSVTVAVGDPYSLFDGTYRISSIPSSTTFRYETSSTVSIERVSLTSPTLTVPGEAPSVIKRAAVANGVVTLELSTIGAHAAGNTATISNTNRDLRIVEKALDAPNAKASIKTETAHGLRVGDTVVLSGLQDYASIVSRTITPSTTTMTTQRPHNLRVGDTITVEGTDSYKIIAMSLTNGTAGLTTDVAHNISSGSTVTVDGLVERAQVSSRSLTSNVATIYTNDAHNYQINSVVTVAGLDDRYSPASVEAVQGVVTLTMPSAHNILIGSKISVGGLGAPFDSASVTVDNITATRIMYTVDRSTWDEQQQIAARNGQDLKIPLNVPQQRVVGGQVVDLNSVFNGEVTVTAKTSNSFSFVRRGNDVPNTGATTMSPAGAYAEGPSILNGSYSITAVGGNMFSYTRSGNNIPGQSVPPAVKDDQIQARVSRPSVNSGVRTITGVSSTTFSFSQALGYDSTQPVSLNARKSSIFNGTRTITEVPQADRFNYAFANAASSVLEETDSRPSFVSATSLYNGMTTLTGVNPITKTVTFNRLLSDYGSKSILGRGVATVTPKIIVSTFGPYPGNANIGIGYSNRTYTGVNIEPIAYRGFELKSVGEALDAYTDSINGFEYRVDCAYDEERNEFSRTLVLIPINFPNPPAPGEVAPLSRYGADKLVFEYPGGSIIDATITESAENSATRFFATGETDLGPDAGPNIGIASSEELLRGKTGRAWPLLDASESISGVDDEDELYAYAERYLSEAAPPYTSLNVSVNGSIAPFVGEYRAGDWCSLIIDDPFIKMRLKSDLEPRDDVLVRKISSYRVKVPDGVTFPETVTLDLVAEWEVDKRGK